jgi:hypothetical protein
LRHAGLCFIAAGDIDRRPSVCICNTLTSVIIPQATSIGDYAFAYCDTLTSASLPQATSIGGHAFYYCYSLTSVNLPQATSIEDYAFAYCDTLTSVRMGQNAPAEATGVFAYITPPPTVYVTNPQATGWGAEWNGAPVVRPPLYGSNVTAQAFTLGGDTITEWPNAITNGMGGLLLATNATGASFVNISGSGGEWGNALQVDGSIYLSKWGTSNIRFPSGAYVSGGTFYGNVGEMGFKSWLGGAERWVIRSLNGNAYIDTGWRPVI